MSKKATQKDWDEYYGFDEGSLKAVENDIKKRKKKGKIW